MQKWFFDPRLVKDRKPFPWVAASPEQISELQKRPGAPHVYFGCRCGTGYWSAKNIALSDKGGYNQMRNIFYFGDTPECSCPATELVCIVPENLGE